MKKSTTALVLAGTLATSVLALAPTASADFNGRLINQGSGKCLEIGGWNTANGADANQWDCTGGANQNWRFVFTGDGDKMLLQNIHSGKCLEVKGWSKDNGAAVGQWDCHGGANQQWIENTDHGGFAYVNVNSGKCLEIGGWSTANGAKANQWDCHWGANQQW